MDNQDMGYGERLKIAMDKAGMTQARLADITGVPQSTISRIVCGGNPTFANALRLEHALPVIRTFDFGDLKHAS